MTFVLILGGKRIVVHEWLSDTDMNFIIPILKVDPDPRALRNLTHLGRSGRVNRSVHIIVMPGGLRIQSIVPVLDRDLAERLVADLLPLPCPATKILCIAVSDPAVAVGA